MASIIETDNGYAFRDDDDFAFTLNEDNAIGYLHRSTPYMDRMSIQDPRDSLWWKWHRCDLPREMFAHIENAIRAVGCVMLRDTPLPEIEEEFDRKHQLNEEDMLRLTDD